MQVFRSKAVLLRAGAAFLICLRLIENDAVTQEPCSGKIASNNVKCNNDSNNCSVVEPADDAFPGDPRFCDGLVYIGNRVTLCVSPTPPNAAANCLPTTLLQDCTFKYYCTHYFNALGEDACRSGRALKPSKTFKVHTPDVECIEVTPGPDTAVVPAS